MGGNINLFVHELIAIGSQRSAPSMRLLLAPHGGSAPHVLRPMLMLMMVVAGLLLAVGVQDAGAAEAGGVQDQYSDFVKAWVNAKLKDMDEEIPPEKSSELWDHILTPDFLAAKEKSKSETPSSAEAAAGDGGAAQKKGSIWSRAVGRMQRTVPGT